LHQKIKSMQTTSFNEVLDIHICKRVTGTGERLKQELLIERLGDAIKKTGKAKHLRRGQPGELAGVQKNTILKSEEFRDLQPFLSYSMFLMLW
jgi:hypothetical protein